MSDNILEIKTVQSNNVKILFEVLKNVLLKDINIIFTPENIKIMEMEGTETAMVYLILNSEAFEYYHCEGIVDIGINSTEMFNIIKKFGNDDVITFYVERNNRKEFKIRAENSEDRILRKSKIKILDIEKKVIKDNVCMDFDSEICLPSVKFQKFIKDLNSLGIDSNIEIKSIGQQLIFSSVGNFSENEIIMGSSSNVKFEKNTDDFEIVQGVFKLKFLVLFTKATNLSQTVRMYLKNNYPLILKYSVGNLGSLSFILKNV